MFTRLVLGNVCVQTEGILKPMKIYWSSTMSKEYYKKYNCHIKLSAPTTRKLQWNKSVTAKICLAWSVLLQNITVK